MSQNSSQPLVSVCVPVYNDQNFIKFAIESVIRQTYQNWELVIINNCSTDATPQIIKAYTDPRIKVITNKTFLDVCANWNEALKNATGEFVKLLHSDDYLADNCLEEQVSIFTSGKYPNVALVTSFRNIIDSNGKFIALRKFPFGSGLIPAQKAINLNFLFGTNVIGEPIFGLFRKSVFAQIGYIDNDNLHVADLDFWCRVLLTGDLYVIPQPLGFFRISRKTNTYKGRKQHTLWFRQYAKKVYKDKRFKINAVRYAICYINTYLIQLLREMFMHFYLKD